MKKSAEQILSSKSFREPELSSSDLKVLLEEDSKLVQLSMNRRLGKGIRHDPRMSEARHIQGTGALSAEHIEAFLRRRVRGSAIHVPASTLPATDSCSWNVLSYPWKPGWAEPATEVVTLADLTGPYWTGDDEIKASSELCGLNSGYISLGVSNGVLFQDFPIEIRFPATDTWAFGDSRSATAQIVYLHWVLDPSPGRVRVDALVSPPPPVTFKNFFPGILIPADKGGLADGWVGAYGGIHFAVHCAGMQPSNPAIAEEEFLWAFKSRTVESKDYSGTPITLSVAFEKPIGIRLLIIVVSAWITALRAGDLDPSAPAIDKPAGFAGIDCSYSGQSQNPGGQPAPGYWSLYGLTSLFTELMLAAIPSWPLSLDRIKVRWCPNELFLQEIAATRTMQGSRVGGPTTGK